MDKHTSKLMQQMLQDDHLCPSVFEHFGVLCIKGLKGWSQTIYLTLDVPYHKRNPLITTVADGNTF